MPKRGRRTEQSMESGCTLLLQVVKEFKRTAYRPKMAILVRCCHVPRKLLPHAGTACAGAQLLCRIHETVSIRYSVSASATTSSGHMYMHMHMHVHMHIPF